MKRSTERREAGGIGEGIRTGSRRVAESALNSVTGLMMTLFRVVGSSAVFMWLAVDVLYQWTEPMLSAQI
jgi:hypothetical protein